MTRVQIALKVFAVLLLAAALANPTVPAESRRRCRFYLVDLSDSVQAVESAPGAIGRERIVEMINYDLRKLAPRDLAAVATFGRTNRFLALPAEAASLGVIETLEPPDDTTATYLVPALEACRTHLPSGAVGEVVIFTDGALFDSEEEIAAAAAALGFEVYLVPVSPANPADARIVSVEHPPRVRVGQPFPVRVGMSATVDSAAILQVGDRRIPVQLLAGSTVYSKVEGVRSSHRALVVTLELEGLQDACPGNNQVRLDLPVESDRPRVLVVRGAESRLAEILTGFDVEVSTSLRTPSDYSAIVLENIPARRLTPAQMEALGEYVEDFGGGLLVLGGPEAYGGEYLDTPLEKILPLRPVPDDRRAVVFVLDVSGSMGREVEAGRRRIDLLKDSVAQAVRVLSPDDWVAVVKIPETGQPVLPLVRLEDGARFARAVEGLQVETFTHILDALRDAGLRILRDVEEGVRKQIVLMTDGETEEKAEEFQKLAVELQAAGVQGTLVQWSEEKTLDALGWPTVKLADIRRLPEILRTALRTEAGLFATNARTEPAPEGWMTRGVEPFVAPRINRTTAKLAAQVMLRSDKGPVGAYRPGRTGGCVALTVGADAAWVGAHGEAIGRLIRNCVERLASAREAPLYVRTVPGGDGLRIRVSLGRGRLPEGVGSVEALYKHLLSGRSGMRPARLRRVDSKTFEGILPDLGPGTYLVDIHALGARGYAARLYGSELERVGIDAPRLATLSRIPGWSLVANFSKFAASPLTRAAYVDRPLRPWLMSLGLVAFLAQLLLGAFWKR